ncbi:MAG: RNA polymerase sigma-70 factor (family 1) [Aureispira sp.]|jgi:RNA polymerase sigma-70 factor (family 1)
MFLLFFYCSLEQNIQSPQKNTEVLTKEEFQACFDKHFDAIRNYLYYRSGDTELATDLAQDVFMRIWEKQMVFEDGRIKGLLYKMASDNFVSHLRKVKVKNEYLQSMPLAFKTEPSESSMDYEVLKSRYEKILSALPEKQRVVFLMSRMNGLTYQEIADRLTISVKAVEKRMRNALGELRTGLQVGMLLLCFYFFGL